MDNNRLISLRVDNDLYQKDIANIIGIGRRTYTSYETNTKIIPLKHLNTLSNYYNVSIDYILNLSDTRTNINIKNINELNRKEIGSRIKEIRKEYNLTVRDVAKELNTTPSTISAYENGKTLILTAFAYQLCKKYNISIDWLCGKTIDKYIK